LYILHQVVTSGKFGQIIGENLDKIWTKYWRKFGQNIGKFELCIGCLATPL
jgi:hypothetical protein